MLHPLLANVKVLVWDLDGTLYKSNQGLSKDIYKAYVQILQDHKSLTLDEATRLLDDTILRFKGLTKSLTFLGCGSSVSIVKRAEKLVDKTSYLNPDYKLQNLFRELSSFEHALVSDTSHLTIVEELEVLGLSTTIFKTIVGVDDTYSVKPDNLFYKKVLQETKKKPSEHLMIGDRIELDLLPAKQLGMKTCLVWNGKKHEGVDFTLPSVYDVANLFKEE